MAYSKAWKIINKTEEEFGVELISRKDPTDLTYGGGPEASDSLP
jgi:molybdenum-dependent DNA-binding transcriptional regulator ModE